MIWDALPIEASASTWGDEIYFGIPVAAGEEMGQEVVELGDLGYWPPGSAFCMFFGPTPMSRGDEIRPASPVTVNRTTCMAIPRHLKRVQSGAPVLIELVPFPFDYDSRIERCVSPLPSWERARVRVSMSNL